MTGEKIQTSKVVEDALKAAKLTGNEEVDIQRAQIAGDGTHDQAIAGIEFDENGVYRTTLRALGSLCPDMFRPQYLSPEVLQVWVQVSNPDAS